MDSPSPKTPPGGRRLHRLGWALFILVALVRSVYCFQMPANTNDVLRHLIYGLEVLDKGWSVADLPLWQIHPAYAGVPFGNRPFNYPVMLLVFDVLVASIWPTVVSFKLALTLVDLATAGLVARAVGRRWGLLYWSLPALIWWSSHEGQLDGVQNLPLVAALMCLRRSPAAAWALLALAVQCKVFAVFLVPWFVYRTVVDSGREGRLRALGSAFVGGAVGSMPTLWAALHFSPVRNMGASFALRYNPYFWDVTHPQIFLWNPSWLVVANQVASYGLVAALLVAGVRYRDGAVVAPLLFIGAVKASMQAQFWYMLVLPAMYTAVSDRRLRAALFLSLPLMDLRATVETFFGPFGYLASWPPITVTTVLTIAS